MKAVHTITYTTAADWNTREHEAQIVGPHNMSKRKLAAEIGDGVTIVRHEWLKDDRK